MAAHADVQEYPEVSRASGSNELRARQHCIADRFEQLTRWAYAIEPSTRFGDPEKSTILCSSTLHYNTACAKQQRNSIDRGRVALAELLRRSLYSSDNRFLLSGTREWSRVYIWDLANTDKPTILHSGFLTYAFPIAVSFSGEDGSIRRSGATAAFVAGMEKPTSLGKFRNLDSHR